MLLSPAELEATGGATGGTDGGGGCGPATDAGDGWNASGPSAGQSGSGARPTRPSATANPMAVPLHALPQFVLSNTGRLIRLTLAAQYTAA